MKNGNEQHCDQCRLHPCQCFAPLIGAQAAGLGKKISTSNDSSGNPEGLNVKKKVRKKCSNCSGDCKNISRCSFIHQKKSDLRPAGPWIGINSPGPKYTTGKQAVQKETIRNKGQSSAKPAPTLSKSMENSFVDKMECQNQPKKCSKCGKCINRCIQNKKQSCLGHCDCLLSQKITKKLMSGLQAKAIVLPSLLLAAGEAIFFDTVKMSYGNGINYDGDNRQFLFQEPGIFRIDWRVGVEGSESAPAISFAVTVNEQVEDFETLPLSLGQLSGSSLLPVQKGSVLSLVNYTGETVLLSNYGPAAGLTITQVGE